MRATQVIAILRRLRRQPLRTALISLQVIVAALLLTIALTAYLHERAVAWERELFSIVFATPGQQVTTTFAPFTPTMLEELLSLAPAVEAVAGFRRVRSRQQIYAGDGRFVLASIAVVSHNFFEVAGLELVQGSFFTEQEVRQGRPVILLEEGAAHSIFGSHDVLGRVVTLLPSLRTTRPEALTQDYQVIGTFRNNFEQRVGRAAISRQGAYLAAYPAYEGSADRHLYSHLVVRAEPGHGQKAREQALTATRVLYDEVRVLQNDQGVEEDEDTPLTVEMAQADFFIEEPDDPLTFFRTVDPNLLLLGLFGIAALIITSVGIFSGAVVEVAERTKEIGVRRVLGASWQIIAISMVAERGLVILLGGLVGIAGATVLLPYVQRWTGGELFSGPSVPVANVQPLIGLAVLALLLVSGVVLSLLVILRAVDMKPAEALREG